MTKDEIKSLFQEFKAYANKNYTGKECSAIVLAAKDIFDQKEKDLHNEDLKIANRFL